MPRKLTHEEFLNKFNKQNKYAKDIEVLGTYVNNRTKIKVRCKIDAHEWEAAPNDLLRGTGCPKCAGNIKKTHEEFIKELVQINDSIEVLEAYKTARTKIRCRCRIDGYEWETLPAVLLSGSGCPKCAINNQTKTHEQFIQQLCQINKDIEVLGTYTGANNKVKVKCKIDGHEWETMPATLLQGHGCPVCGKLSVKQKLSKTHEQFIKDLHEVNKDIEVLDTYINNRAKIKVRCKKDGYEWQATPSSLLCGEGCPVCGRISVAQKNTKTYEQFMYEMKIKHPDIEVLEPYKGSKVKIKVKCKIDGYEWQALPNDLLNGHGCPQCYNNRRGNTLRSTHTEFINKLSQINQDIEVLDTYKNAYTKIKVRCLKDGYMWEARPGNLLHGYGCPKCGITKGEKRVAQYLDNIGIEYIYNKSYFNDLVGTGGGKLKPDFIIPTLKIWIEYDGIQHYKPVDFSKGKMSEQEVQQLFEYTQQNDNIKNQYAKDNNWTLIRIPYWEIDNIEQILDNYIKEQEQAIN